MEWPTNYNGVAFVVWLVSRGYGMSGVWLGGMALPEMLCFSH